MRVARTWNLHTHSRFSVGDALPSVEDIVTEVVSLNQAAIGLTDHGNMGGTVQLYRAAKKHGLLPFPGTELYVVPDRTDKKAKRHHMCVVAYTAQGYENLVRINTKAGANFFHKPLIDHTDLAELSEAGMLRGIAATSGCYFGLTAQAMVAGDTLGAELLLKTYAGWFDSFYVELQNHEIAHDEEWNDDLLADALWGSATRLGLPCVLTQDSHYVHEEDKETHDGLKRLVAFGPDPDDAVFPGDGFHLADDVWFRTHHHGDRFGAGVAGLQDLLAKHSLTIPELDSYHYNIPFTVPDPQAALTERTTLELAARGLGDAYLDRLSDELEIIGDVGMAGYLLLVAEVTDWCVANRVFYQARGSASGSVVCWLLGITQADPIKHKLSFGRFISRDRTKPPDIDLDVESDRRGELIEYLSGRFAVHQIGTWMEYSLAGDDEDAKGSLRVKYFSARNRAAEAGTGTKANTWDDVEHEDRRMLYRLSDLKPFASYGVHAAGLVVTTTADDFDRLVPTMKVASSATYVTQYEMDDIEALGLVKLDVLGLKTLSVLHACMDFLGRDVFEGLDWIPTRDDKTFAEIAKGRTAGVFQLEGYAAQRGVRDLKPTKLADIIASMALFRPATMNSGATASYVARKHGREKIPVRHELLDKHTKSTYGIFLFQEQVISVLRDLGMDADHLTKFLKAVKASNSAIGNAGKVIDGYRDWVWGAAIDAGFGRKDWEWFWESVTGFAAYGFNQAHSTAYGITAYRCAYLATHHPLEFHAALLKVAVGSKKEADYVHAARAKGLRIAKASVNHSDISYTVLRVGKRERILRGLSAIKGVGPKAAAEIVAKRPEGGYASLDDFCQRVDHRKITGTRAWLESNDTGVGTFRVLWEYGAFDSITEED